MKHWEMLAVFVHVHAQVCVEVDESAQPVQICAQTGNPVISVAKKGWFADEHRNLLTGLLYWDTLYASLSMPNWQFT